MRQNPSEGSMRVGGAGGAESAKDTASGAAEGNN